MRPRHSTGLDCCSAEFLLIGLLEHLGLADGSISIAWLSCRRRLLGRQGLTRSRSGACRRPSHGQTLDVRLKTFLELLRRAEHFAGQCPVVGCGVPTFSRPLSTSQGPDGVLSISSGSSCGLHERLLASRPTLLEMRLSLSATVGVAQVVGGPWSSWPTSRSRLSSIPVKAGLQPTAS